MAISHKKKYGIYHWDTFDNVTLLVDEADTIEQANSKIHNRYGSRFSMQGADCVEIVDKKGCIIARFNIK
jgi:hypothetical protein